MIYLRETIVWLCIMFEMRHMCFKLGYNIAVCFPIEEMAQEPCERCCEHS
jgi:hypothetical protein